MQRRKARRTGEAKPSGLFGFNKIGSDTEMKEIRLGETGDGVGAEFMDSIRER